MMKHATLLLAFCMVVSSAPTMAADTAAAERPSWSQWRGLSRDGHVAGPTWPDRLVQDDLVPLWRVPLGPSYSGPIVNDQMVFTTETKDKESEVVYGLDRATGQQRWSAEWKGAMKVPFFAASNGSWIRSTPACDGESLYVAGMRDVLVCLDATTGKQKWRVDFMERFGSALPAFGFVCSPLVDGDAVYIQAGGSVVKLDRKNGKDLWHTLSDGGGMGGSAFSSPVIATLAGKRQLLVQTRKQLAGIDTESGRVLWTQNVPAYRGMNILTPLVVGDTIFTSSYRNNSWLFRVSRNEDQFDVSTIWSNNAQGYMSTPVVVDGHVYLHLQNRRFTCIDLATGERTWTSTPFAKYASLLAQDDRILALCSDGRLLLMRADSAQFDVIGDVRIADAETWAHLAVSGDELFVRELNALAAYRWTGVKNP